MRPTLRFPYCSWCRGPQRPDCKHLEPSATDLWAQEWRDRQADLYCAERIDMADEAAFPEQPE